MPTQTTEPKSSASSTAKGNESPTSSSSPEMKQEPAKPSATKQLTSSKPTPEESRKAFKQFQKGKGRAHDVLGHSHSCVKCNHANEIANAVMDPTRPPTMSPDCILYSHPTAYIPARAPRCFCSKEPSPSLQHTYATLHDLFIRRLKLHDLPIVFYEEVAELEKQMIPEMMRDAMLGKVYVGPSNSFAPDPVYGTDGEAPPGKSPGRKKRRHPFRLSDYPDPEARLEMRIELLRAIKGLSKELLFDSTAPLVLEELAYCGDVHGYSSLAHGPPCACVLNLCRPCLKVLAQRLIPKTNPRPLPRSPPDHAFLMYSAKALKAQYLSKETSAAMDRGDWEEELKACQRRAGDVLWQMAMEIDLIKASKEIIGVLERAYDEDFYQGLLPMYKPEPGFEKESFKPVRNINQINHYLDEIGIDFEDDLQAKREKAEREKEKGNGAYKRGMFQRAAKHFSNAMELDPCEVVYPLNRSLPLIKLKKYRTAERDCTHCISLNPRNTKALYRRALARKGLGQLVEAEIDLKMVLVIEPTNQASLKELEEISHILCQTPGSSAGHLTGIQSKIPLVVDSATAKAERQDSVTYWKERLATTVNPDDSPHRGKTGYPCAAFNLNEQGCPQGSNCFDSHAPDQYSLRVHAFNRNICTNNLLGRDCRPEDYNIDGDEPETFVCPYMHVESEDDKKIVWNEMQDLADKLHTDMSLDLAQIGFVSAVKASMDGAPAAATAPLGGMSIPPEVQRILQEGMQSILEKSGSEGAAQFDGLLEKMHISFDLPIRSQKAGQPRKSSTKQKG